MLMEDITKLESFLTDHKLPLKMTFDRAKILFIPLFGLAGTKELIAYKRLESIKAWFYKQYNIQLYSATRLEKSHVKDHWYFTLGLKVLFKIKDNLIFTKKGIVKTITGEATDFAMIYRFENNIVKLDSIRIQFEYIDHKTNNGYKQRFQKTKLYDVIEEDNKIRLRFNISYD